MSTYTTTRHVHTRVAGAMRPSARSLRRRAVRGRTSAVVTLEWTAVLLVAAALVATLLWFSAAGVNGEVPTRPVRVESGDSLWSLAAAHPVEGLNTDQTVQLIRQVNEIDGSTLHAGQLLHVPDAAPGTPAVAQR